MDTFDELCDKLIEHAAPEDLVDIMRLTSWDIIDRFEDRAMAHQDELQEYVDEYIK